MADFGMPLPRMNQLTDAPESGELSKTATPQRPEYRKQKQSNKPPGSSVNWMIIVDEGWRSWILCADMYEWAADGLLEILRASGHRWPG